ncbi:hypothetical protein JR338_09780 [Chloroflexota bacterium]|nr:hypothetical protein JR338_09780 [Chloroflexota bacterium]
MPFLIRVFNSIPIGPVDPQEVLAAITASNYQTLCRQYGLDPVLIEPGLSQLSVLTAPDLAAPFFTVVYRENGEPPIVVNIDEWDARNFEAVAFVPPAGLRSVFFDAVQLVSIELEEDQLQDLGLLLAYEVARWAAFQGKGILLGLDGRWYRLNAHKAFLPVGDPS